MRRRVGKPAVIVLREAVAVSMVGSRVWRVTVKNRSGVFMLPITRKASQRPVCAFCGRIAYSAVNAPRLFAGFAGNSPLRPQPKLPPGIEP
jgi:hypothetical protein